jgi:hypothetical protein
VATTDGPESGPDNDLLFTRLVALADTLVNGFDVADLAAELVSGCLELLPVAAAGIMLDDEQGDLRVLASSSEQMRLLELVELQHNEGPCLEAYASAAPVGAPDLDAAAQRWPRFVREARRQGFLASYALPLQLRDRTVGALDLLCDRRTPMGADELRVAEVMTTMATLGLLHHQAVRRSEVLAGQLQAALDSRIVIEQAKGVIAERAGVDMSAAFQLLRSNARDSRRRLSEVAAEVAHRRMSPTTLAPGGPSRRADRNR